VNDFQHTDVAATRAAPPSSRNAIVRFVRRRPLTAWLIWAFTVGQALAFIPVIGALNGVEVLTRPLVWQTFVCASSVIGLFLPAAVITRIVDGSEGLQAYWRSAFAVGVPARWYALAFLGVPVVATVLALALFGPPAPGASVASVLLTGFVLQTVLTFLPNNWWEEVGWMGFVQRRLQDRYGSAVRAALLTAPLFGLYHISLVALAGARGALTIGILILLAVPFRIVMGWAFNRTGSLFMVGLLHAVGNGMALGAGFGFGTGVIPALYPDAALAGFIHLLSFVIIGIAVLVTTRGRAGLHAQVPCPSDRAQAEPAPSPRRGDVIDRVGQIEV
jgi:membrane protease YdiL (CAAX protease family)